MESETNHHIFLNCPAFNDIRKKLPNLKINENLNFLSILFHYSSQTEVLIKIITIFLFIWNLRNKFIFNQTPINTIHIWNQHKLYTNKTQLTNNTKKFMRIKWKLPPKGWYKINVDGAACSNPGVAGIGGIIRDDKENVITAFSKNTGHSSNNKAEV